MCQKGTLVIDLHLAVFFKDFCPFFMKETNGCSTDLELSLRFGWGAQCVWWNRLIYYETTRRGS